MNVYFSRVRVLFLFVCLAFFTGPVFSQTTTGGRSAFEILKISPACRAMAVGGAYTALGDDIASLYYNPAGLASVLTNELGLTYLSLYQNFNYESVAYACPLGTAFQTIDGTLALSVNLLQPGNMSRLNDQGVTVGNFSSSDSVYSLAYARSFGMVHAGFSVKYIQQQIDNIQSSLLEGDAGLIFVPPFDGMRVGVCMKNIGVQSDGFNLPFVINAGISYRHFGMFSEMDDAALTAEGVFPLKPIEEKVGMRVGGEYDFKWIGSKVSLRAGYAFLDNDLEGVGFSAGAGYGLDFGKALIYIDYAFSPADIFGNAHRVSLTTKF
jgi:hypothetical protein